MASSFEIDLLLIGFASATCSIMFSAAPARRLLMGIALGCAVGIVLVAVIGSYRILLAVALVYLLRDWWQERCNARAGSRSPAREDF